MSFASDNFWKLLESQMDCSVPLYIKNILRLRGFDNALSVRTLTVKDIDSLETFARTKMSKYIASGADLKDYYHIFSKEPESFEILPGHIRLLNEIVRHVTVMAATTKDPMVLDPDTAFDMETSHSIGRKQEATSTEEVGLVCQEKCKDSNVLSKDQRDLKQEQPQASYTTKLDDMLQNKAKIVMVPDTFKALITVGSPNIFYIQLESSFGELDQLEVFLEPASSWPMLKEVMVGQICAALYDGSFYRAKVLSLCDDGMSSRSKLV